MADGFDLEVGTLSDEALSDLIAQHLAVKGFCSLAPGFYSVAPTQARAEAELLVFRSVNTVVAEGLLGPEGSAGLADLDESSIVRKDCGSLMLVDDALTRLWHIIAPYTEYIGAEMVRRSNSVVHRSGEEAECPLTERDVTKWQSQFLRHTLLLVTFLGIGHVELRPYEDDDDEVEPFRIRTMPGCILLVRADMIVCRYSAPEHTLALSCFLCAGADRRGVPARVSRVTPAAKTLEEWTVQRLEELKAQQEEGESGWDPDIPRAWQSAMNHSFHRGQLTGIASDACYLPDTANGDHFYLRAHAGPDYATEVPVERWDQRLFFNEDVEAEGQVTYCNHGVFMEGLELFDNKFFALSAFEARGLDPQARAVLEVGYTAFFNMGFNKKKLNNTAGGVYVGATNNEWAYRGQLMPHNISAGGFCFFSGRISYCLGLKGPSLSISTEAASGLTATLLASESVQQKGTAVGTDHAIAVGVNLLMSPVSWITDCYSRWLSKRGRCMTFDGSADGYIRGDGCCCVGVKTTGKVVDGGVVKNDEYFLGTIAGGMMSNSGGSASMTVADSSAEQQVASDAVLNAGITGGDVDSVEVHGSGGLLSDAVEVHALRRAHRGEPQPDRLALSCVKSSVGNQVECGGITALIRLVHAAQWGHVPPNVHLRMASPYVDMFEEPLDCMAETLESPFRSTFNGVKSRGLGGSHVYLLTWGMLASEQAEPVEQAESQLDRRPVPKSWPGRTDQHARRGGRGGIDQTYSLAASWLGWDLQEMSADDAVPGRFFLNTTLPSGGGGEFHVLRDANWEQAFYPAWPTSDGSAPGDVLGPGGTEASYSWFLDGSSEQVYRIEFQCVEGYSKDTYKLSWRQLPSRLPGE